MSERSACRSAVLALALAASSVGSACTAGTDRPDAEPPVHVSPSSSAPAGDAAEVPIVDLDQIDRLRSLPWYRGVPLPRRIPSDDQQLPSLPDDPPGRVVMALRPDITELNSPVGSWSEIGILLYGRDGGWRRLDLGELGLDESDLFTDTYGSGRLSPDGRQWLGPMHDGGVLVDLETGAATTRRESVPGLGSATWIPGSRTLTWRGTSLDLVTGESSRTPWRSTSEVGFEPDGTPVFVAAGPDGGAVLFEWHEGEAVARAPLADVFTPSTRRPTGVVSNGRLVAIAQDSGTVVVDAWTGAIVGELRHRPGTLVYDDQWIDGETLFVARTPYFLAWRPATGEVLRVADARALGDYWEIDLAELS